MRTPSALLLPHAIAGLCLTLALGSCGGGDVSLPPDGEPFAIEVLDGDKQTGRVGDPLDLPLMVQVTDARGVPVAGAMVAFQFSQAGPGAAVVPEQKATDSDGKADTRLVLGTTVGPQTGQARVVLPEGRDPIQVGFSATALPENANSMAAVGGLDQTGHVGQPLDDRLVVEVIDGFGNPVSGVEITWTADGGGSVSEAVVPTDQDGRSRVQRILGPAVGVQTTTATAQNLAGSPVIFTHTAVPGDANRLTVVSGNGQTAEAGTTLPEELVVRLVDADGNGVPNTAVTWVVASGGGSVSAVNTTTDADGRTSTRWTLGPALGEQRVDAVVSGVGVATFRATAASAAPASLFIRTQPSPTARNGIPLARQPVVQLHDGQGNDVSAAGVEITAYLGGGGELGGTIRQTTDATGKATFTDLSISGAPGPRTLVFQAVGYAQVTSDEIVLEAIGTTTTITGDSPDPSAVGGTVTVSFQVTSSGPTPTGSVTVSDGAQSCSGALSNGSGSCALDLATAGSRTLTATYAGEPGLNGSSDTESHTVMDNPPSNQAPTAEFATTCDELECRFEDRSSDPDGRIEQRAWNFGDGETSDQRDPRHEFPNSGTYQVSLTVTDNDGAAATVTHDVTVSQSAASTSTRFETDDPDPTIPGQSFTVTLSVRSDRATPQGSATVSDGVNGCTIQIVDGVGSCTLALNTVGDRTLTATFQGSASFATSSATEDHTVEPTPVQSLLIREQPSGSATIGEAFNSQPEIELRIGNDPRQQSGVVVTASIASGGGTLGGTPTAVTDSDGRAQFSDLRIDGATGTHTLRFTADGYGEVISSSIEVRQAQSQTQITSHQPEPAIVGQSVSVGVGVTGGGGTPSGTVTVDGENVAQSCTITLSGGSGSCEISFTAAGDNRITASYGGDVRFSASSDDTGHETDPLPPANQAPTANDDAATTDTDVAVTIPVRNNDTDPELSPLSIAGISTPSSGTAVENGGSIIYTPNPGYSGGDSFTYTLSDGSLTSNAATVTVTVNPPPPGAEVLGLLTTPPPAVQSGVVLQPEPEVELRDASLNPVSLEGVNIHAEIVSGDGSLAGADQATDTNGVARFDNLTINGAAEGSSVTLAFSAPGLAGVNSPPIVIQGN